MHFNQQLSHLRAIMGITHGSRAFGGPVQASLALTSRCNLRCIHCYFYSKYLDRPTHQILRKAKMMGDELPDHEALRRLQNMDADTERFQTVIDELLKMGTRRFQLSSNGEVFLHKSILEFIARLKRCGSYCLTNTNGTLLNPTIIDELIRLGFDDLRITVMAGTAQMYVRTHPGTPPETFSKLKSNLLYLAQQKAILRLRHPEITLIYIVIAQNVEGIFDFAEFAAQVGATRVWYRPVDDVGDKGLANLVPSKEQALQVQQQLTEVKAYLESRDIAHNIENFQKVFCTQLDTTALHRIIPCYYGWLSVMIEPDGEVYPCCRCYEPLGNIHQQSFAEIWNGPAYRRFRKEAIAINRRKKPVNCCDCNSCVHHTANLRVYKALHPFKGHSAQVQCLSPAGLEEE